MSHPANFGYGPPPSPPPANSDRRWVFAGLGAVIVAGLVVIVLAVTGVFTPDAAAPDRASPRNAAERFMQASKDQNVADLKAAVCTRDLTDAQLNAIVGDDHATDYSITKVEQLSDLAAVVTVNVKTDTGNATETELPIVKQDGDWRVCLSERNAATDTPSASTSSAPTSGASLPSGTSLPTSPAGLCSAQTSALRVAKLFVGYIGFDSVDLAAKCVYANRLGSAQLKALTGASLYSLSPGQSQTGPTFTFTSIDNASTIVVTVEKEPDGKYYVTAATKR